MLEVEKLTRFYGKKAAIENLSFTLRPHEVVALLGLNGAGKTTTLRILTGYLFPSSGTVRIMGEDLFADLQKARQRIGYLPENPRLYREMTVESFLRYVYRMRLGKTAEEEDRVRYALMRTHLEGREKDKIRTLSAGLRKRLALAQAIVHQPPLLILDEPVSDLDPQQIAQMRQLILELKKEHTILLSSHILREVSQIADRFLFLRQGHLVAEEDRQSLGRYEDLEKLRLRLAHNYDLETLLRQYPGFVQCEREDQHTYLLVFEKGKLDLTKLGELLWEKKIIAVEMRKLELELEEIFLKIAA
ncbi:MAG: ABC transporter ATP-binding protein [Leptospiraceae bacterium]|nr:ABC transporter ATP-binding protein [Leptospiraceae bacterium]MDW8307088.1 ABC transporter ATP-binding protein [Leptospiraceae bacterium]